MKIKLCFAACIAALSLVGCNEKVINLPSDGEMIDLTVDVSGPETRLTGAYQDKKINNVQVFVFDRLGVLEATTVSESASISVKCRTGIKTIVALANAEAVGNVGTYEELAHRRADLMTMTEGNEVMVGVTQDTLKTDRKVLLNVRRLAAKVCLNHISVNFQGPQYLNKRVTLKSIYLMNAAGDKCYLADDAPSKWYNEGKYEPDNCPSVIYDGNIGDVIISGSNSRYVEHYFYCYPNGADKKTYLVVETEIDGETFYYPVDLGVVESGHCYTCYLRIRHLGSYSPDIPVKDISVNSDVTVYPWVYEDTFGAEI